MSEEQIVDIAYRPLDIRKTYFDSQVVCEEKNVMQHFADGENIGLMLSKQVNAFSDYHHVFITSKIAESCLVSNKTGEISYCFPVELIQNNSRVEKHES